MTRIMCFLFVLLLTANVTSYANNVETGWMTILQPDGTVFEGRGFGDEFEFYWESKDGYKIKKNYDNGYWYYAVLNSKGGFDCSDLKVKIDNPSSKNLSRNLSYAGQYKADIERQRSEFELELKEKRENLKKRKGLRKASSTRTITVDLLMVEFADVTHNTSYSSSDFNQMFASSGTYTGSPSPHPDGKEVFGSVHDYWDDITNGDVNVTGAVWNTTWVSLPQNKSYYQLGTTNQFRAAVEAATTYDFTALDADNLVAIIYAGNEYLSGGLHPHASGYKYYMAEEFSRPQNYENASNFFANIGTHCHELGHTGFGLYDRYGSYNYSQWGLMALGNKNDPSNELACPATLNPYDREDNGWISFTTITGNEIDKELSYSYTSPDVYKIGESGYSFFLIENRQKTYGFDKYLPSQGILVWEKLGYSNLNLIEADNVQSDATDSGDTFPGSSNKRNLNDFTTPDISYYNGDNSSVVLHNISDNSSTMEVDIGDKWFGEIPENVTWSGDVEIGSDVDVPSGKTLTISSGTDITFDAGSDLDLTILGTLLANGASFTSSSATANSWYGIVFDGATSSSTIENCTIEWASRGIIIDDCSPTIEGNELDNNQYGIWVHGSTSDPTITENDIDNGSLPLVVSSDAEPTIEDNKSKGLNNCLYIASGGYPEMLNNTFYGYTNGTYQVYITGSSSGYKSAQASGDGNYFTDDVLRDIVQIDGGSSFYFSYDVFENVSSSTYDYIDNDDASWCYAQYCYWDDGGAPSSSYFDGNVNYSNELAAEPAAGVTWKRVVQEPTHFDYGFQLYEDKEYENAVMVLKSSFESNKDHKDANKALFLMARAAMRIPDKSPYIAFLTDILSSQDNEESKQIARSFLMKNAFQSGDLAKAESYAMQAPKGQLYDRELMLDMVYYYALVKDNAGEQRMIATLKRTYSDDESIEEAIANAKLLVDDERELLANDQSKKEQSSDTNVIDSEDIVLHAFPNPFNPSTVIQFALPETQNVNIQIFDVLGRQVRLLLDRKMQQGKKQVMWDGRNNTGVNVAAGIYFVNLKTGTKIKTTKILLVR